MRAAVCREVVGRGGIMVDEVPSPPLGSRDVRVRVAYAALNFMDLLIIAGRYQHKPQVPFIVGHDAAGIVIEVGSEVSGFQVGNRVSVGGTTGAFGEEMVAPATRAVRLPDTIDLRTAAAYRGSYCAALYALRTRAQLSVTERLVVMGAAGGVGLAAMQIGGVIGAKVLGVVSSEDKAAILRQEGMDVVVVQETSTLRDRIRTVFHDGFDVALDTVGGNALLELVKGAAWDARLLVVGFAAGIPKVPANRVLLNSSSLIGVNYGAAQDRDLACTAAIHSDLLRWIGEGRLKPRVAAEFPLEQVHDALELLGSRTTSGKIVLRIGST